jgi:hypothetical protein
LIVFSAFSIQYYKDTQINWFAFTALFNGLTAMQEPNTDKARPKPLNWQDVLAVNTYWGFIHAQSYIAVINDCLHLNIPNDVAALDMLNLEFEGKDKLRFRNLRYLTKEPSGEVVEGIVSENRPFLFMANLYTIWALEDNDLGRKRAKDLHNLYMSWDRSVSKMIHDRVYGTDEGKQALRSFHDPKTE